MASEIFVAGSSAPDGVARSGGTGKSTGEMTMDANELRALADALPEGVHWSDPITPEMLAEAIKRFCADAQPVAWMRPDNRVREESFTGTQFSRGEQRPPIGTWNPLYLHPAPAVPQAEPITDSDADYWLRNRRPILDAIERAGFALMSNASGFWLHPRGTTAPQAEPKPTPASGDDLNVYKEMADNYRNDAQAEPKRGPLLGELMREQRQSRIVAGVYPDGNPNAGAMMAQTRQAEPKRGPLSDERIDTALQTDPVLITRLMIGSMTVGEFRAALRRLARIVERALEIGGSDAGTD